MNYLIQQLEVPAASQLTLNQFDWKNMMLPTMSMFSSPTCSAM
jgi:hypothetical protein